MTQILAVFCNVFHLQSADSSILNRVDQDNTKVVPENLSLHNTSASTFAGDGLPFLALSPFSLFLPRASKTQKTSQVEVIYHN